MGFLDGGEFLSLFYILNDLVVQGLFFFFAVTFFSMQSTSENIEDIEDFIFSDLLPDIFGDAEDEFIRGSNLWRFLACSTLLNFTGYF